MLDSLLRLGAPSFLDGRSLEDARRSDGLGPCSRFEALLPELLQLRLGVLAPEVLEAARLAGFLYHVLVVLSVFYS